MTRRLASAWWFGGAPLLATLATWRWLVPPPAASGPGLWGWLAEVAALHALPLAVGFFVLFSLLARAWRDRLGLGDAVGVTSEARASRTLPQRITALALLVLPLLVAFTVRGRLGQLYEVVGASMLPTLSPGDTLLVSKSRSAPVRRADIVAFTTRGLPTGQAAAETLVKRVIGLPGDHVQLRGGIPRINGWEVPHCDAGTYVRYAANGTLVGRLLVEWLEDRVYLAVHVPGTRSFPGFEVPPGQVFVLGDDRSNSDDSRAWNQGRGAGVPLGAIEGRPWRLIGSDADGAVDLHRFLQRPGLQVLDGAPAADLAARRALGETRAGGHVTGRAPSWCRIVALLQPAAHGRPSTMSKREVGDPVGLPAHTTASKPQKAHPMWPALICQIGWKMALLVAPTHGRSFGWRVAVIATAIVGSWLVCAEAHP
jgi:signal peptidase I